MSVSISGCVSNSGELDVINKTTGTEIFEHPQGAAVVLDKGDFKVSYAQLENNKYLELENALKQSQLFENMVYEINKILILPNDIDIVFGECGVANAFYDPETKRIIMCYDFMTMMGNTFSSVSTTEEELGYSVLYSTIFFFYHEMGHALIDNLNIPVTGREEDAADQLSAIILAESGEYGENALLNSAVLFLMLSEKSELSEIKFAGEHALEKQRFYNILCWLYGKNSTKYSYLITQGYLPQERAVRCEQEYIKMSNSWDVLLADYVKR